MQKRIRDKKQPDPVLVGRQGRAGDLEGRIRSLPDPIRPKKRGHAIAPQTEEVSVFDPLQAFLKNGTQMQGMHDDQPLSNGKESGIRPCFWRRGIRCLNYRMDNGHSWSAVSG